MWAVGKEDTEVSHCLPLTVFLTQHSLLAEGCPDVLHVHFFHHRTFSRSPWAPSALPLEKCLNSGSTHAVAHKLITGLNSKARAATDLIQESKNEFAKRPSVRRTTEPGLRGSFQDSSSSPAHATEHQLPLSCAARSPTPGR